MEQIGITDLGNGFALIQANEDVLALHKTVEKALATYRGIQFSSGGMLFADNEARLIKTSVSKEEMLVNGIAGWSENGKWTMFYLACCAMATSDIKERAMAFVMNKILEAEKEPLA